MARNQRLRDAAQIREIVDNLIDSDGDDDDSSQDTDFEDHVSVNSDEGEVMMIDGDGHRTVEYAYEDIDTPHPRRIQLRGQTSTTDIEINQPGTTSTNNIEPNSFSNINIFEFEEEADERRTTLPDVVAEQELIINVRSPLDRATRRLDFNASTTFTSVSTSAREPDLGPAQNKRPRGRPTGRGTSSAPTQLADSRPTLQQVTRRLNLSEVTAHTRRTNITNRFRNGVQQYPPPEGSSSHSAAHERRSATRLQEGSNTQAAGQSAQAAGSSQRALGVSAGAAASSARAVSSSARAASSSARAASSSAGAASSSAGAASSSAGAASSSARAAGSRARAAGPSARAAGQSELARAPPQTVQSATPSATTCPLTPASPRVNNCEATTATTRPPARTTPNTSPRRSPRRRNTTFVSVDGTVWDKEPPTTRRARQHNIRRDNGPRPNVPPHKAITNPVDAFMLFLQPIIHLIVTYTNTKAASVHSENNYKTTWRDVDATEIQAFVGIVLMAGKLHQSKQSILVMWDAQLGTPLFRATMSMHRFKQITRFMRFDDPDNRPRDDKFAPIRVVWDIVNNLLEKYYIPGDNMTGDEQLLAYRGNCGFRQYMPSKPAKYGIKFWVNNDAQTYYPLKIVPYLGKEGNQRAVGLGSQVIIKLCTPYYRTGRNITCDNYFTSYELAKILLQNGITIIGTLKKNKRFLPEEFKPAKNRPVGSSVFGFRNDATIVSYVPGPNKSVALLSTMHHDARIDPIKNKPDIIMDYNDTKGGTDTFDQMAHTYTCKRGTRRWPMACFYNLMDTSGIAAYVIWSLTYPDWNKNVPHRRRLFIDSVAKSLMRPLLLRRYDTARHRNTRDTVGQVLEAQGVGVANRPEEQVEHALGRKRRCHVCPRAKDRKIKQTCHTCSKPVCSEHSKRVCLGC